MKRKYPRVSIKTICELFGKSRQVSYDRSKVYRKRQLEASIVLAWVRQIQEELPRAGVHKLHLMLKSRLEEHGIKMGRDRLWCLLQYHNLLVPIRGRKSPKATDSFHDFWKYPNLVKVLTPTRLGRLWVSDITDVRLRDDGFAYLSLITDAYSRKIIGHYLGPNLYTTGPVRVLEMVLKERVRPEIRLIPHSDRGIQYCSNRYTSILKKMAVRITTKYVAAPSSHPLERRPERRLCVTS